MYRLTSSDRLRSAALRRSDGLHRERGAVATIVAMMLGFGVLLGFGALTIDVGNLLWERRQLQNGADASALDLARICGTSTAAATACSSGNAVTRTSLEQLVDGNANDGAASLSAMCAGGPAAAGVSLGPCVAPDATQLSNCPPLPAKYASGFSYVQTHTRTETKTGGTILPAIVAQTITGNPGTAVGACARATWGTPGTAQSMAPVTISQCEWEDASNLGANYAAPPVYGTGNWWGYGGAGQPTTPWGREVVLYTHYNDVPATFPCGHEDTNGRATNGGFSYLSKDSCFVNVTIPKWNLGENGNSTGCAESSLVGKTILLPVHWCDSVSNTGAPSGGPTASLCNNSGGGKPYYYVTGWASFYVSGAQFSGSGMTIPGASTNCAWPARSIAGKGSYRCIRGWFTKGVIETDALVSPVPGNPSTPGNNFGAIGVVPAG